MVYARRCEGVCETGKSVTGTVTGSLVRSSSFEA